MKAFMSVVVLALSSSTAFASPQFLPFTTRGQIPSPPAGAICPQFTGTWEGSCTLGSDGQSEEQDSTVTIRQHECGQIEFISATIYGDALLQIPGKFATSNTGDIFKEEKTFTMNWSDDKEALVSDLVLVKEFADGFNQKTTGSIVFNLNEESNLLVSSKFKHEVNGQASEATSDCVYTKVAEQK